MTSASPYTLAAKKEFGGLEIAFLSLELAHRSQDNESNSSTARGKVLIQSIKIDFPLPFDKNLS